MRSYKFFCMPLFALAAALLLGGCIAGGFISVPRLPTDIVADAITGGGRSSLYVEGNLCYYALPTARMYVDTLTGFKVVELKEHSALPSDDNYIHFAAEPGSAPQGMYLKRVVCRLDLIGRPWEIRSNFNRTDGHAWTFSIQNDRNGSHVLFIGFQFVNPMDESQTVTREIRLPLYMARSRWDGLTR